MARLIDADNLIKDIEIAKSTHRYEDIGCRCFRRGMDRAIRIARQQPTIDPVKHGHWIYVGAHNGVHLFECSLCHCGLNTENPDWLSKYCSGCGAKMEVNTND